MGQPAQAVSALATLWRNENLRRVELAWGASITAEYAHFVALGVFAYTAGGTSAAGIAGLVRMLPAAVVGPFAASLGDRFRRERFLIAIALLGSAALGGSAAAFFLGRNEAVVFGLGAVVGVASTLFRPALQAVLPSLARTPEELIAANAGTSTLESLGTLVGPVVAGALVSVSDAGVAFLVGSGVLLAAAVLLLRVRVEGRIQVAAAGEPARARELVTAGFRLVASAPKPRLILGLTTAQAFVRGCLNVLIVVAAFRLFGAGSGAVGYLTAAIGVGGLVGAFGAMTLEGRRLAAPFGIALIFWGVPIALIAASPHLAAALILLAVVGAANSVEDVVCGRRRDPPVAELARLAPARPHRPRGAGAGGRARAGGRRPDVRAALDRREGAHGGQARGGSRGRGRGGHPRGRPRRPVLRRRRRGARGHERPALEGRSRRLLRRDRTPPRRAADGDGEGHGAVAPVRARARRLSRRGDRALGGALGGGSRGEKTGGT